MAYIEIINEDAATGTLKEDYDYLATTYSRLFGHDILAPNVYRSSSLVPEYFRFGVREFRSISKDGTTVRAEGAFPGFLATFAVSQHASCFY